MKPQDNLKKEKKTAFFHITEFNPFTLSGLLYHNSLDRSISDSCSGVWLVFSSPEGKLRVSYCDHPLSCRPMSFTVHHLLFVINN